MNYRYTKSEINKIMKNFVVIIDSREKNAESTMQYFRDKKIKFVIEKIDTGDYASKITACPELGIMRDVYIPAKIEKKADFSEIAGNLSKASETRFISELIRSQGAPFTLLVADEKGYENLLYGQYNSAYKPASLLGRINTLKARYGFELVYMSEKYIGNYIYYHLYYHAMEHIKNLQIQINKEDISYVEEKEPTAN